jgi:hypothetical protein
MITLSRRQEGGKRTQGQSWNGALLVVTRTQDVICEKFVICVGMSGQQG